MNKIPYESTKKECKYGHFGSQPASYVVTNGNELKAPWYYIYQNRQILLYLDQNGPVKMQYEPPSGILIFKRELGENQSKWQVWITSPQINGGVPVSNFNNPTLRYDLAKPQFTVEWQPEKAIYTSKYDTADVITEIFVPTDRATVCMKTTIKNKTDKDMDISVVPSVFPYVNIPQMVAWDLPEWYLASKPMLNGKTFCIAGQMTCPEMIKENHRSITFNMDYDKDATFALDMASYTGSGNFFAPNSVLNGADLPYKMADANSTARFGGQQSVYAVKYQTKLKAGESKTYTQVMTVQKSLSYDQEQNDFEQGYFDDNSYGKFVDKAREFYKHLFTRRTIKTSNPIVNDFINYFAPLQMYWVCSLDRGWPSSMRGIRDASQDFMGMCHLDPVWTRQLIIDLYEHQQVDGWMPRQISTKSRTAPHDMRYYSDGGAFLLELIHEYMTFTRDFSLLDEKIWWLDSDEESTILEHIFRTIDFYLAPKNIGEHGLCKVWYGDWWDPMDKIGMDGRGESVTVTAQNVLNLKNLADMLKWLVESGKLDKSYIKVADGYMVARESFIKAMNEYAFNKNGFYNGYFNDNGKWLLADVDADGKERMYLVSNAWALISGCADKDKKQKVLDNVIRLCKNENGYNTKSIGYAVAVDKAGRVGNGTSPGAGTYNHAQSFLVRACCTAGKPEMAYDVTKYIYPINQDFADVELTCAPPYAIANSYSCSKATPRRVGFQFLSGTVSYVLRTFYSFFMGITYGYSGLTIKTELPKAFGDCTAEFSYLGKKFTLKYNFTDGKSNKITFNGKVWDKTEYSVEAEKDYPYIADGDFADENVIEIDY